MHKHCLMLLLIASSPISHIAISIPMLSPLPSGALTSLDLSENELGAEGAKHVAEAVKDHVRGLLYSIGFI